MSEQEKELLAVALPILQGLLASGHYIKPDVGSSPTIIRGDNGENWKKEGHSRRRPAWAVEDAMAIADELMEEIRFESAIRKKLEEE